MFQFFHFNQNTTAFRFSLPLNKWNSHPIIKDKRCLHKYCFSECWEKLRFVSLLQMQAMITLLRENFNLTNSFPNSTSEGNLKILTFTSIRITNTQTSARQLLQRTLRTRDLNHALKFNPNYNGFNISSRSFKICHVLLRTEFQFIQINNEPTKIWG